MLWLALLPLGSVLLVCLGCSLSLPLLDLLGSPPGLLTGSNAQALGLQVRMLVSWTASTCCEFLIAAGVWGSSLLLLLFSYVAVAGLPLLLLLWFRSGGVLCGGGGDVMSPLRLPSGRCLRASAPGAPGPALRRGAVASSLARPALPRLCLHCDDDGGERTAGLLISPLLFGSRAAKGRDRRRAGPPVLPGAERCGLLLHEATCRAPPGWAGGGCNGCHVAISPPCFCLLTPDLGAL